MTMSIKTLAEFYREHSYAIPFEIMLLSKNNDTQESFKLRRENNLKLLLAFKFINEETKINPQAK